ncbi:MAG TPA: tetratricopeptide repeat protein, partial [Blastocatellia bacterium]|nr:tetratricopeptide repeat protein [Blastocatellia bacterium]
HQAIGSDPNYALAYAGLADSYNILASYSALAPKDAFPRAKAAATKALELDDKLAEAHASLAFVKFGYDWDWAEAEKAFKRSLELNPGYAPAHQWYALYLAAMNRMDEAIAGMSRAGELDPLSLPINTNSGWIFYLARRFDKAIEMYHKTLELEPDFTLARRRLGQAYEQKRMYPEARAEFEKCLALSEGDMETMAALGHVYAVAGDRAGARQVMDEMIALSKERYVPSYLIAIIWLALGDADATFEWLEKAYEERYGFLAYLAVGPIFDPIRSDPRYEELARRVGLAP